ncbi:MAG: hypothetical protein ACR2NL_03665, partial [Acidimicrobiia bacterium]
MTDVHDGNEEALLSRLQKGLTASDPVPADVSEFAKASLAWRTIDAELASMTVDSSSEDMPAGVRSTATARMLSFEAGSWTIEMEYNPSSGRLIGQIDPSRD